MRIKTTLTTPFVIIGAFILCIISGCNEGNETRLDSRFKLEKTGQIVFRIDSMTKQEHAINGYSQYYDALCVYNELNHSIYLFNIESQETSKIIQLEREGPNGISRVKAILLHNPDSIFIYNDATNKLILLSENTQVLKRYSVFDRETGDPALVLEPEIYLSDGHIYFLSRVATFTYKEKNKNILKYSLEDGSKAYLMDYPESYQDGKWSSIILNKYALSDQNSNQFILSFPFDPFIHVFNERLNKTEKYYAGSNLMRQPQQISAKEKSNTGDYLLGNSWYNRLFYDPYRKIYLRSAFTGYNMVKGRKTKDIENVTIILDKDFQKIGEVAHLHFFKSTFSTIDGIYIQDFNSEPDNEDLMVFSQYQLVEKFNAKN